MKLETTPSSRTSIAYEETTPTSDSMKPKFDRTLYKMFNLHV